MDKQTALILGALAIAGALFYFTTRGSSSSDSAAPPPTSSSGEPLPEARVIAVSEAIYRLARQVYDDVRTRQAAGART